jgi:hypothetical protein
VGFNSQSSAACCPLGGWKRGGVGDPAHEVALERVGAERGSTGWSNITECSLFLRHIYHSSVELCYRTPGLLTKRQGVFANKI